eukprot:6207081-Pleurochrysis_carterae.AAC.2
MVGREMRKNAQTQPPTHARRLRPCVRTWCTLVTLSGPRESNSLPLIDCKKQRCDARKQTSRKRTTRTVEKQAQGERITCWRRARALRNTARRACAAPT